MKGLEPSTPGATVQCSNQLSYTHHMSSLRSEFQISDQAICNLRFEICNPEGVLARQKGLEPLTYGLEGRCSIQLSYWRQISTQDADGEDEKTGFQLPAANC